MNSNNEPMMTIIQTRPNTLTDEQYQKNIFTRGRKKSQICLLITISEDTHIAAGNNACEQVKWKSVEELSLAIGNSKEKYCLDRH